MSSAVETDAEFAVGASLTGVTVIDTVADEDVAEPSETVNENESEPLKFAAGVYVRSAPDPDSEP